MSETSRMEQLFFRLFESLPRQGPGNRASLERALELCGTFAPRPAVLDLGCGTGAQTLQLAEELAGPLVAVDLHAPNVRRLQAELHGSPLASRVVALHADMARLPFPRASFDLVWSEGALYNLGLDEGLAVCRELLRPGGRLAFTEAVWRTTDPPAQVRASFADYEGMGDVANALGKLERAGFATLGHFPLPDEAWWEDFYTPLVQRIEQLRGSSEDAETLRALDALEAEPAMHREHGSHYGYEFFVACLP